MTPKPGGLLVLNAGSSGLKFSLFEAVPAPDRDHLLYEGEVSGLGDKLRLRAGDGRARFPEEQRAEGPADHAAALDWVLDWTDARSGGLPLVAAGHRVVHGGAGNTRPVRLDEQVIAELAQLVPLAPLHQPPALAAMAALSRRHPGLPQVACFDTTFHTSQPAVATAFALPRALTSQGLRRYGFHGLSCEYIVGRLPGVLGDAAADGRIVIAHLGSGASLTAVRQRHSVASTMGFTALDGLPMSQRCGSLDPGVVLYLLQHEGMTGAQISDLLYQRSGLLGVSGLSGHMHTLLGSPDPRAEEAIALFVYRIGRELGSLAAALGGLDALVFTAGIGENAAPIRARVCEQARWLGLHLDEAANETHGPCITRPDSPASAWVIATDEDLVIARHTAVLCGAGG